MSPVGRPVHGIDLGQMALQCLLRLHQLVLWDLLVSLLGDGSDCAALSVSKTRYIGIRGMNATALINHTTSWQRRHTRCIGELILLPLNLVLQGLSLATRLLDAGLHGLGRDLSRPTVGVHGERTISSMDIETS